MKTHYFSLLALATTLCSTPAFALSDQEIQDAVSAVVSQRHPTDTADWWRGLGPAAPAVIEGMYASSSSTYQRIRMLEGLGWFNDPGAASFIEQQAESTPDDVIRNAALRTLGAGQGAKEEDFISKYLQHPDPQTRIAAAEALQRIGDPRAQSLVSSYMAQEKTSWIVARLKGEVARPTAALTPTGSSEDRLSPDFSGTWKGFWVYPRPDSKSGMRSEPVEAHLKNQGATELTGDISIKSAGKIRTLKLAEASGKASRIKAKWAGAKASQDTVPEEIPFEGALVSRGGSFVLRLESARTGGTFVLRRDR